MRPRLIVLLLLLLGVAAVASVVARRRKAANWFRYGSIQAASQHFTALEASAAQHDTTTWQATRAFDEADAWVARAVDQIMNSPNRWSALRDFARTRPDANQLLAAADRWENEGWILERVTARPGSAVVSQTPEGIGLGRYSAELLASRGSEHAAVQATFVVKGAIGAETSTEIIETPEVLFDTANLEIHRARTQFRPWVEFVIPLPAHTFFADPLLYRETLDGPELLLVSAQLRLQLVVTNGAARLAAKSLPSLPPDRAVAAALADADGDGWADLWLAGREGLSIAKGRADGTFGLPELCWRSPEPLIYPQALAIGDFDLDGDLDVWLTQYKNPYQKGQFPTPYYDANDGFPSFLLRHENGLRFTNITGAAGLASKRLRRTYSTSLIDLDGDGKLDLVNVSDFAGLDVYRNDGQGRFGDITARLGEHRQGFGMAHLITDLNGDQFPDLLMVGMESPWAARLDTLGLGRTEFPDHSRRRSAMTWGNRVFVGLQAGLQPDVSAASKSLAHAGWAWGVAELDVENDGRPDYYFANGHETRASQRDYERQFWLHDLYAATSVYDPGADLYFQSTAARRAAEQRSYGGWQHQALLHNEGTNGFVESAWLLGCSVFADGRNVIAADFDGDGRVDLAVTTVEGWPQVQQRLIVFHNETVEVGHWLGIRFVEGQGHKSPLNARVEIRTTQGTRRRWLVTGDSYRSQQTVQVHCGLGSLDVVEEALVCWSDGTTTQLSHPSVDHWHRVP